MHEHWLANLCAKFGLDRTTTSVLAKRTLAKTKHPAHWRVNVLRQKTMSTIGYLQPLEGQIDMIGPTTRRGDNVATHSRAAQPDAKALMALPAHSLTLKAYKKELYTRLSAQKTLQLRFDNCRRYTEVPSTSISGNGESVGHQHSLYQSDPAVVTRK